MKVIGYVRVSTGRQVEEGYGLDVQEAAVRRWTREHGHRLVRIVRDEAVSGASDLDDRPGLADALDDLRAGRAVGLVVPRLDRLARDLIVQEQLLAEVRRLGADVHTCAAGEAGYLADDPDDPSRRLIRQVLGAVSEYERSMISLRLRSGRARKAAAGGYAYGAPRFGTRADAGDLVVDPDEAATVARIEELAAEGRSLREIARTLDDEGLRPKRGSRWHPYSVARVRARAGAAA